VRPNAVNDHWAPLPEGVIPLRAWCLDHVERVVADRPELINAAAVRLRDEKEPQTLRALLDKLRTAQTLDDVLNVFDPDSARAGEGAPAPAGPGVGGL